MIKDKNKLIERVNLSVLPLIDGKNFDKLILYYSLLTENEDVFETHIKMLKRLKHVTFEDRFDYKKLLDKPLETLNLTVNDSTLQFFSKNASNLTSVINDNKIKLTPSRIHSIFYLKKYHLWLDNTTSINEIHQINEQFESLKDYLKTITNELDCMSLIHEVILGERTIKRLSLTDRKEFLKRYLRLFKKSSNNVDLKSSPAVQFSYEDIYYYLLKVQDHLKMTENLNGLLQGEKNEFKINIDIELSRLLDTVEDSRVNEHDLGAIEDLLLKMLFNGYKIENLHQILLLIKQNNLTIKDLVKNYFIKIFNFIEKNERRFENIEILEKFLKILSGYLNIGSSNMLITQEDVMEYVIGYFVII